MMASDAAAKNARKEIRMVVWIFERKLQVAEQRYGDSREGEFMRISAAVFQERNDFPPLSPASFLDDLSTGVFAETCER